MSEHILIVGAGQAGMEIASTLREEDFTGAITLVGREALGPYQRPPLSKGYLTGAIDDEELEFRAADFYDSHRITLVTGEEIADIQLAGQGGVATAASGTQYAFDKLALTPGSEPRRLLVEGAELDGVLYLRDVEDARALKARWTRARHVVVIGGGFIGLEVAAAARVAGKPVTVIELSDRLLGRAVAPVTSDFFYDAHRRRGMDILLDAQLTRIIGNAGVVSSVELTTGEVISADVVLVGIGAIPRSVLAAKIGLETINGAIVVDDTAATSQPGVVAAGDAVALPHPLGIDVQVRLESVQNAVDQARVAALTLLGRPRPYRTVPWFWSDQGDLKLQIAGLSIGYDQVVLRGNPASERFAVLYYRDGAIIAIDAINQPAEYIAVRRALATGAALPPDKAADTSVPLRSQVVAA